jgi:hypothetical protein
MIFLENLYEKLKIRLAYLPNVIWNLVTERNIRFLAKFQIKNPRDKITRIPDFI